MRKKWIAGLLALLLLPVMLPLSHAEEEIPLLQFVAVSDLHLDDILFQTSDENIDQYRRALRMANDRGITTMVCGGDISSYGDTDYWYKAKDIAREEGMTNMIWALGNHAYGTSGLARDVRNKFLSFAQRDSIWFATEINGYQFVVLAVDHGNITQFGEFGDEQLHWFAEALRNAAEKSDGKPIFVVSHFDLGTGDTRELLEPELSKYDNVFFLWGHEHGFGGDDMTLADIVTDEPGYTAAKMGMMHWYRTDTAEGLLVRVYRDRVEFEVMRVGGVELFPNESCYVNSYTVSLIDETGETISREKVKHGTNYVPREDSDSIVWLGDDVVTEPTSWQAVYRPVWQASGDETEVSVMLPQRESAILVAVAVYDENQRQVGSTLLPMNSGSAQTVSVRVPGVGTSVRVYQINEETGAPFYKAMDANAS